MLLNRISDLILEELHQRVHGSLPSVFFLDELAITHQLQCWVFWYMVLTGNISCIITRKYNIHVHENMIHTWSCLYKKTLIFIFLKPISWSFLIIVLNKVILPEYRFDDNVIVRYRGTCIYAGVNSEIYVFIVFKCKIYIQIGWTILAKDFL